MRIYLFNVLILMYVCWCWKTCLRALLQTSKGKHKNSMMHKLCRKKWWWNAACLLVALETVLCSVTCRSDYKKTGSSCRETCVDFILKHCVEICKIKFTSTCILWVHRNQCEIETYMCTTLSTSGPWSVLQNILQLCVTRDCMAFWVQGHVCKTFSGALLKYMHHLIPSFEKRTCEEDDTGPRVTFSSSEIAPKWLFFSKICVCVCIYNIYTHCVCVCVCVCVYMYVSVYIYAKYFLFSLLVSFFFF